MNRNRLRVLIANQRADRLARLAAIVTECGHEVIAREIRVDAAAASTARMRPDVALVGLGESSDHALAMISEIVRGAFCPVIALLGAYDAAWVTKAAEHGVYAYIVDTRPQELQSAIDITLRRFGELHELQGAFEQRDARLKLEAERIVVRRREMLELHDGVVQGLTLAQLALDLDQTDEARQAVGRSLDGARAIVARSLEELLDEGISLDDLLRDAVSTSS